MNIEEIYQSISSLWSRISPILLFHFLAIILIVWLIGRDWYILERIEHALNSEKYLRWKKIIDEFSLRPTIPYLLLIVLFLYLILINNVLGLFNGFSPLSIVYSETEFWEESRPLYELTQLASYESKDMSPGSIYLLKERLLEEYKSQYPERYRSLVEWISNRFGTWSTYYRLSLLFFILLITMMIIQLRHRNDKTINISKLFFVVLLTVVTITFCRYKAEQTIEKELKAELYFVIEQLEQDDSKQEDQISNDDLNILQCNLFTKLSITDTDAKHTFWISRYLEDISLGIREFPHMSDEEFIKAYEYIERNCPQLP